jgi:L-lactate dehydrogenase complex protein LldG
MSDAMMNDPLSARSEILARIRSANHGIFGADRDLTPDESWQTILRTYRRDSSLSHAARIQLLTERLIEYGAGVYRCQPAQVAENVSEILRSRSQQRVLVSSDVGPNWLPHQGAMFVYDKTLPYSDIEACDGVLTGCTVAIATTGTLVLCHTSDGSRRALTLLPDYHLCFVNAATIVETVPEGLRALEPHRLQPITLISGPSATADIEMTRIQGVHGPRVLDCLIVVEDFV